MRLGPNLKIVPPVREAITSTLRLLHVPLGFDLLVDPGDYISILLVRDGVFEAPESDLVTRIIRNGDICIDAGCQIGYYSCLLATLVGETGRVYSFDASPQACHSTRRNLALNGLYCAEVIQAALADSSGTVPFHISTDDQTGLSSLGPIPACKETISVPCLRLEEFLNERRIDRVRLLKIDVEGAEEQVLRGLGHVLADHIIDYVLVECFDERLSLLNTSTEAVVGVLKSAGYIPWEYGTQNSAGWSKQVEVRSRGDCNYLFTSAAVAENVPSVSLASALIWTQNQKVKLVDQTSKLQYQRDRLQEERDKLHNERDKLHNDLDWLLSSIKAHEEESARLAEAKLQLEGVLNGVLNSAGWRMLSKWRKLRNWLAPENTWHRRLYNSVLGNFKSKS